MFLVGETYKLKRWEDSDDGGLITEHYGCKVLEVKGTLVKFQQYEHEPIIINTASVAFVAAELDKE